MPSFASSLIDMNKIAKSEHRNRTVSQCVGDEVHGTEQVGCCHVTCVLDESRVDVDCNACPPQAVQAVGCSITAAADTESVITPDGRKRIFADLALWARNFPRGAVDILGQ